MKKSENREIDLKRTFLHSEKPQEDHENLILKELLTKVEKILHRIKKMMQINYLLFTLLISIVAIFMIFLQEDSCKEVIFVGLIVLFTLIIILALNMFSDLKNKQYKSEYRKYLVNELHTDELLRVDEDKESVSNNISINGNISSVNNIKKIENRDIIARMLNNHDEIREYFTISKKHAKSSYRFSILASIIGFFMIGIAMYEVFHENRADLTIIGVVSGAISEFVAGLVLWIHNKSAMQLNYYYDSLHENEKFLAAINMADKLSEEKREEMYIEIIRKQIEIHST